MEKLIQTQKIPSNGQIVQNKNMLNVMTPQHRNAQQNRITKNQFPPSQNQYASIESCSLSGKMPPKKKTPEIWMPQDYEHLYEAYFIHGPKWTKLAYILNKSDNTVKNKFYAQIRKLIRKLSHICRTAKPRKSITYEALIRPVEAQDYCDEPYPNYNTDKNELKKRIINYSKSEIETMSKEECQELIDDIHHFNLQTRSYNLKIQKNDAEDKRSETSTVQGVNIEERGDQSSSENIDIEKSFNRMMSNAQIEKLYEQVAKYEIKNSWEIEMSDSFHLLV